MKITVLAENISHNPKIESEHGLSLYIECEAGNILFDMGQSDLFCRNAERLGVDLSEVDIAILSHGHYDHGGGALSFRRINATAPLYISRHAFGKFYSDKYIGLPGGLEEDPHLIKTEGILSLGKGLTLFANPQAPRCDFPDALLTREKSGVRLPDDFCHEQYLLIEEQGKRVLFSGCSHRGIAGIVRYFSPNVLVGGFHFKNVSDRAVLQTQAQKLLAADTAYYTCHCTGAAQYDFLKTIMGERLQYLSCGQSLTL